MAKYSLIKTFLASERWIRFRLGLIAERGPVCQKCGRVITNPLDCIGHHITELTPENVNDPMISLNPQNVLIVCYDCHNEIHHRFGHTAERGIYIVYGPPLAGKTTFVRERMMRGDLVVDMDEIYAAVSLQPEFDKPNELLSNVLGVRDKLLDNIKTRYGKWNSAWIIGGYEDRFKREQLASDLNAELIFCDVSREECLRRLEINEALRYRKDEYRGYIDKWFDRYVA
jgi:predicted kinase